VIAHASVLTEGIAEHADVVFPAESYAEKEGTVTHPDGRLQRLRPAIGRPGSVRAEWSVLAELAERVGLPAGPLTGPMVTAMLAGGPGSRRRPPSAWPSPTALPSRWPGPAPAWPPRRPSAARFPRAPSSWPRAWSAPGPTR